MADIKSDRSEIIHYDNPDFPVFIRKNYIMAHTCFPNMSLHWHDDLEFIYVLEGRIRYMLDGKIIKMAAGEGIFVNARHIHVIMNEDVDCVLICVIFPPTLLCSSPVVTQTYVKPVLDAGNIDYVLLDHKVPWKAEILESVGKIYEDSLKEESELSIMQTIYSLWNVIYKNVEIEKNRKDFSDVSLRIFKQMIEYVQENYNQKISLQTLCTSVGIGKNRCTEIFNRYTNMSPIEYIRYYRIEKSIEYLRDTDMSITEVAYAVGFGGASYYAETFRKYLGYSPSQVRQEMGPF